MRKRLFITGIMICLFAVGVVYAQTEGIAEPTEPAPVTPVPVASNYQNFTTLERLGTVAINALIFPGLGSYVIMNDTLGGNIQLAMEGVAIGLCIGAAVTVYNKASNIYTHDTVTIEDMLSRSVLTKAQGSVGLLVAAIAIGTANRIFNVVRSFAYDKPQPKVGSLADPNAWSLSVLPGKDGIETVQLAYTLRY